MKKRAFSLILCISLVLTACGSTGKTITSANKVADVINSQIENEDSGETTAATVENTAKEKSSEKDASVDIDLTTMSSDMVYATVYDFMSNPDDYIGMTVKVSGTNGSSYYEETDKTYHYLWIADAAACCGQGLEYVLNKGDYPADDSEQTVIGTFETYEEVWDGETLTYCNLVNAKVQ